MDDSSIPVDPFAPIPTSLLPQTAAVRADGHLEIGGCDVVALAEEFGTPLFVYDEAHLRLRCREAVTAFGDGVAYASKAFLCKAMARLVHEEGMCLDVASGGELATVLAAGVPADRVVLHGNNKSHDELAMAIAAGIRRVVVDSNDEIDRIEAIVSPGQRVPVLLLVTPGVEVHTHEYVQTGQEDSKFGLSIASGAASAALERLSASPAIDLKGIHAHIGSQVFDTGSFARAAEVLADFFLPLGLEELCVGGGLGVAYVVGEEAPTLTEWAASTIAALRARGIADSVSITAEPGRSIVAQAAVTVYRVGTIKEVAGIRTYLAVDGGMSDNPRPVLYGSGYEAFDPAAVSADRTEVTRVVGKHCESGDVILPEARIPASIGVGSLLATPVTGAYGYAMASTYNKVPRPAVLFVADGVARVVVRRETYEDLASLDQ